MAVPVEVEIKFVPVTEGAAPTKGVTEVGGVGIKPEVKQKVPNAEYEVKYFPLRGLSDG